MWPKMRLGWGQHRREQRQHVRAANEARQRAELDLDTGGAEGVLHEGGVQLCDFTMALKRNRKRGDGVAASFSRPRQ